MEASGGGGGGVHNKLSPFHGQYCHLLVMHRQYLLCFSTVIMRRLDSDIYRQTDRQIDFIDTIYINF